VDLYFTSLRPRLIFLVLNLVWEFEKIMLFFQNYCTGHSHNNDESRIYERKFLLFFCANCCTKARVKRHTSHELNRILKRENKGSLVSHLPNCSHNLNPIVVQLLQFSTKTCNKEKQWRSGKFSEIRIQKPLALTFPTYWNLPINLEKTYCVRMLKEWISRLSSSNLLFR